MYAHYRKAHTPRDCMQARARLMGYQDMRHALTVLRSHGLATRRIARKFSVTHKTVWSWLRFYRLPTADNEVLWRFDVQWERCPAAAPIDWPNRVRRSLDGGGE